MIGKNEDGSWKKFEDLLPSEIEEICNGCGGKGGIIKPPLAIFFDTSCDHHDYGYFKGGTEKDRLRCDVQLKKAMMRDCSKLKWYKYLLYRPWCEGYFIAVRTFGSGYFNYI